MKTINFQGQKCYIAYKGFKNEELENYQGNHKYELNNWYLYLKVDEDVTNDCSYGGNLFDNKFDCFDFIDTEYVYECYVPIKNNINVFIKNSSKFRTKKFYLSDKKVNLDDYEKHWGELTEKQKDLICIYNKDFDYEKYWSELTKYQKNYICKFNKNFDYDKYWDELTEEQKDLICKFNRNFDYEKHWEELTDFQKNLICEYNKDFDYEKYWNELTKYQKDLICKFNRNFDYEKHWKELTGIQKDSICKCNKNFDYEKYWGKLTEYQKDLIYCNVVIKE